MNSPSSHKSHCIRALLCTTPWRPLEPSSVFWSQVSPVRQVTVAKSVFLTVLISVDSLSTRIVKNRIVFCSGISKREEESGLGGVWTAYLLLGLWWFFNFYSHIETFKNAYYVQHCRLIIKDRNMCKRYMVSVFHELKSSGQNKYVCK